MKKLLILLCLITHFAFAQQEIPLYTGTIPNSQPSAAPLDTTLVKGTKDGIDRIMGVVRPTMTVFLPNPAKATGSAVIICPGGGYNILAIGHEGYDIAKRLNQEGIAAFVLKYRLPKGGIMVDKKIGPLQDAQRAIQLVRQNAKQWNVNPNKVGILGSSAGGHLAATAGTHFDDAKIDNPNKINLRPDFMILNYPVISFTDSLTHQGSRQNLIGTKVFSTGAKVPSKAKDLGMSEADINYFSAEKQVTPRTPPTFITSALTDQAVPVGNSLAFITALEQNKVPVEVFFYDKGVHGYGMINSRAKEQWIDACLRWIKKNYDPAPMDWANLKRYEEENKKLLPPKANETRIVFMGNSITEGWSKFDPGFFEVNHFINRGIGGQTTPQMVLRFKQDVIDLKPSVVVILAGTNDIAGNTGPMTLEQSRDNIITMIQLAQVNGIKVVLSSVIPAFDYPWRPGLDPATKIVSLNKMLKEYAEKNNIVYIDYFSAMVDEQNGLRKELGYDGVHPNLEGYKVMEPLAEKAIAEALKRK